MKKPIRRRRAGPTFSERQRALARVLGKPSDTHLHAVIPFDFGPEIGGAADVLQFRKHVRGVAYATCELLGRPDQIRNELGAYELLVCLRRPNDWGPRIIAELAHETLRSRLQPGDTMDLPPWVPKRAKLGALYFAEYARFRFQGKAAGILLCIGITRDEWEICQAGCGDMLDATLREERVFPFTEPRRESVLKIRVQTSPRSRPRHMSEPESARLRRR